MTYAEKLKDPRWQRKRLEIFQRDNFTCQFCGSVNSTLHVHHKYYLPNKDPWDYNNNALITSCEICHEWEYENNEQIEKNFFIILYDFGLNPNDLTFLTYNFDPFEMKEISKNEILDNIISLLNNLKDK